jgi:ABC-type nitrate/sulfonate/bicarbonate transport system permease component
MRLHRGGRSAAERLASRATLIRTLIIVGVVVTWDLVVRVGLVDPLFLTGPLEVVKAVGALAGDPLAQEAFSSTGVSIVTAFVIGTSAGIVVAALLGGSPLLRKAFLSPLLFILSTPKSIFMPIFVLMFGISGTSAAAFGAFEAFFYVVVNVLGGIELVEDRHLRVARAFCASRFHKYVDVIGPAALPGLFAALWYGVKHAFLGVMIAQLWASRGGIGDLIRTYSTTLQTDYVLAVVLVVTLAAILAGALWTRVEDRLNRWRGSRGTAVTAGLAA